MSGGPEHKPDGDPCSCGIAANRHRRRKRSRAAYYRQYRGDGMILDRPIIAIDGEGYTTAGGEHLYTYLAACTETETIAELRARRGVRAGRVFEWLLALPRPALIVGFSLGYDVCKWVESMPDKIIYAIMHPEERTDEEGPIPVWWRDYQVNLISTKLTIRRKRESVTVWDVWKFFRTSFVKALRTWGVGEEQDIAAIEAMKERRGVFAGISEEEETYCKNECRLLSALVYRLIEAHNEVGLRLTTYFGPGSTASVMLGRMGATRAAYPTAMGEAIRCAFFGGRFEHSTLGPMT